MDGYYEIGYEEVSGGDKEDNQDDMPERCTYHSHSKGHILKILLLGSDRIKEFLESNGDEVTVYNEFLTLYQATTFDYIISYGYRHILTKEIVDRFRHKAINLHISYLPWNRGADPNYWSWKENTPKGVTIHEIDYGIDEGRILAQHFVQMDDNETLRSSYNKLQVAMVGLFKFKWNSIRGSYHKKSDMPDLPLGWETPVKDI